MGGPPDGQRTASPRQALLQRPPTEREALAERVAGALDIPFTAGGVLFVLVLVADTLTPASSPWSVAWDVSAWLLWALFVLEFVLRLVIAPSTARFLRRNWWQLLFLAVPFLRFARAFTRSARLARVLSSAVRGSRTARRQLTDRLAWLAAVTGIVVLSSSQVLYELGPPMTYLEALHDCALGTVSGEPIGRGGAVADTLEILLAVYSTVVFAALAGSLGAFFLERQGERREQAAAVIGTAPAGHEGGGR